MGQGATMGRDVGVVAAVAEQMCAPVARFSVEGGSRPAS
jgi:hypothetical protein